MSGRNVSENDLHVMFQSFLQAADHIHTAMCLFDDDHTAQAKLNDAMHSALSGAEMCRQIRAKRQPREGGPGDG